MLDSIQTLCPFGITISVKPFRSLAGAYVITTAPAHPAGEAPAVGAERTDT
jgi:hypothetical protein